MTNTTPFCLRRPNSRQCYGKFDHRFVHFPETYFPTHEGPWSKSIPGYSGSNDFPDDMDTSNWSYFEFNNIGGNFRLNTDVGVRYNPGINLSNYNNGEVYEVSSHNPNNPGGMGSFNLDNYHLISSYYYQAAREEIKFMHDDEDRKGKAQYYYDHIPRIFKGYGSVISDESNSGALTIDSGHPFQDFCDNGCRHLVLTSHEKCEASFSTVPENTEVHCLPKYLNLRVNHLLKIDSNIFDISGYDSVRIDDLVVSFTPGAKIYEINSAVADGDGVASEYINYLLPRLSYVFSGTEIINLGSETERLNNPEISNDSNYLFSFNNSYYRILSTSYNSFIQDVPPWIVAKGQTTNGEVVYDAYQMAVMGYFLYKNNFVCKDASLNNLLDSAGNAIVVDRTSCDGVTPISAKRDVFYPPIEVSAQ